MINSEDHKRYVRKALEEADWWDAAAGRHERDAINCRKQAESRREHAAFYEQQLEQKEAAE